METLYYRINHKNNLKLFDNASLVQLKTNLFYELSLIDDSTIGNEINKFFNKILECSDKLDKFEIIFHTINEYMKLRDFDLNDEEYNINLCQQISIRNYKMEFVFSSEFVHDIATLLCFGYTKLKEARWKKKLTYDKFLLNLQQFPSKNVDLIKEYRNYNSKNVLNTFIIPNEFILLMNIFQGIKTLKMTFEESSSDLTKAYIILLLNYEWLFPFVFEIEFDLTCHKLYRLINIEYKKKMKYEEQINQMNNNSEYNNNDTNINDNYQIIKNKPIKNYLQTLKENKDIFDLVIVYTYFISKFHFLRNLTIIFPNSFKTELEDFMRLNKVPMVNFHFLNLLFPINLLHSLSLEFNSMENESFQNIMNLIQNNSNLKNLSINFFSQNQEIYSNPLLVKLSEENGIRLKSIFLNTGNYISTIMYKNDGEFENLLINKVLPNFELNIEKFFILLQTKKQLDCLTLIFEQPKLLLNNENYFWVIMKFLFNIFLMLNREKFQLQELKLIAPNLNFDNKKNPLIESFLDGINLNNKNKNLIRFSLQAQISKLPNICNLISKNIEILILGDFDLDTFKSFITFYQSENFIQESNLNSLSIILSKSLIDYDSFKETFSNLIQGNQPKNLIQIEFECNIKIPAFDLSQILLKTNGNTIEKYSFKFKVNQEEYLKFDYDSYWFFNNNLKKRLNKYLGLIMKYQFYVKEKKNIGKKLIQYLMPNNKKEIIILNNI